MKERLTGAVVLVVVGVLVIPALLDGPGERESERHDLALPAAEGGETRTRTIVVGAPTNDAPRDASEAGDGPVPIPAPSTRRSSSTSGTPPGPKPAGVTDNGSQTPAAAQSTVDAPARPSGATTSPRPAPPSAQPGFAVQVGSFARESNARRFAELLRNDGFDAFVVRNVVDGVVRFRVRVGTEPDRDRAGELAGRLAEAGHPTSIVEHP